VYLVYEDGPLAFVAEVASPSTRAADMRNRDEVYAPVLHVPEYLWIDLRRHELQLWTLVENRYERVLSDEHGRFWSRELGVGFVWQDDRRLVRVLLADGTVLPTPEEATEQAAAAIARAERAARQAERAARRATEQEAARAAAEQRASELADELKRLRHLLDAQGQEPERG
jgi:hypothetical protein